MPIINNGWKHSKLLSNQDPIYCTILRESNTNVPPPSPPKTTKFPYQTQTTFRQDVLGQNHLPKSFSFACESIHNEPRACERRTGRNGRPGSVPIFLYSLLSAQHGKLSDRAMDFKKRLNQDSCDSNMIFLSINLG